MAFAIPTLQDLTARARQAFRAYLPGSDAWLWPNNIYASAKVIAGMVFEVFGFADYIQKQKFAVTAPDLESLALHGAEFGIPQRPASPARGFVTVTTTDTLLVDAGAVFARTDGMQYLATVGGSLTVPGSADVEVVAVTDGKVSNADPGTPLAIVSGVTGSATASARADAVGIAGGADVEDIESWRARILFRKRNPPHGGSPADYVMWAESVSGVTQGKVFVERRWSGPGTVRVFPLMWDLYPNGIAPAGDIERVNDYLQSVAPAGAIVTTQAPTAVPVNIIISGLTPNTSAVQEAVLAELRDAFRRLARVAGNDAQIGGLDYLAYPTTFSVSWIWQAVANASGEQRHKITLPADDIALSDGQFPTLGTVTFG